MTVLKETLCGKGEKKKQTLVAVERARELGKLRAHAHDLLAAQELLRNDGGSTTNKVATQVNHDGLTLEHLQNTQKTTTTKKRTTKKKKRQQNKTTLFSSKEKGNSFLALKRKLRLCQKEFKYT